MTRLKYYLLLLILIGTMAGCYTPGTYPNKPIELVIGYAPGGSLDLEARVWQEYLEYELNTKVMIKYIDGAGGRIATEYMYRAKPDGYTLYLDNFNPSIIGQVIFDDNYNMDDFVYVGSGSIGYWVLAAPQDSLYHNMSDMLETTETVRIGHAGRGTLTHLIIERLRQDGPYPHVIDVPFDGGAHAFSGVLAGECDVILVPEITAYRGSDELHVIATISPDGSRSEIFPDITTNIEQGYTIDGLFAARRHFLLPPETPAEIANTLREAVHHISNNPEFIAAMHQQQMPLVHTTELEYRELIIETTHILEQYSHLFTR